MAWRLRRGRQDLLSNPSYSLYVYYPPDPSFKAHPGVCVVCARVREIKREGGEAGKAFVPIFQTQGQTDLQRSFPMVQAELLDSGFCREKHTAILSIRTA